MALPTIPRLSLSDFFNRIIIIDIKINNKNSYCIVIVTSIKTFQPRGLDFARKFI